MYTVNYTLQFKRAVKLCIRRGLDVNKIAELVDILRVRGVLPRKYKPHKLSGYKGGMTWECHIEPNWLLIWEQNDTHLTLLMLETGTHSDLFG